MSKTRQGCPAVDDMHIAAHAHWCTDIRLLVRRRDTMAFTLPDLPMGYDALEPYIDATTMQVHHE